MNTLLKKNFITGNKIKKQKGITLVEILVTIFIFSMIIGGVFNIFYSQIRAQNRALKESVLFDNLSYTLEYMGRSLRMAKRDDGSCISENYTMEIFGTGVKFKNYKNECQYFYLENGFLKQKINDNDSVNLTPTNVEVEQFNVYLMGQFKLDNFQPRTTVVLKAKSKTSKEIYSSSVRVQTTISSRNLDVK